MRSYELSRDLIALVSLLEKKKTKKEETPDADAQRKSHGESSCQKPNPADILILDFQFPDCEKIHFCCSSAQSMMLYHGSFSRLIHHSKCGLWINRTRMTWEFVRNTESQAPLQTMGTRIYIFSRSTGALRSPALEDVCQGFLRRMGKGYGGNVWWRAEIRRLCLVTSAPQGEQTSKSLKIQIPSPGKFSLFDPND